jgi:hypothetical protein
MIRPFLTFVIEYFLVFLVIRYGKVHKWVFAAVLFLLATYQLGEFIIFVTGGNIIGFKIAYVATTLLPPLGVLLIERITKKQFGYFIFQLLALVFAFYILIIPEIALKYEFGPFCIRIFQYEQVIANYWSYYYQGTLMYSMFLMIWGIFRAKTEKVRLQLKLILLGYFSFNGLAIVITYFIPWFQYSTASLMCALALIAAFIFTKVALAENLSTLQDQAMKFKILP